MTPFARRPTGVFVLALEASAAQDVRREAEVVVHERCRAFRSTFLRRIPFWENTDERDVTAISLVIVFPFLAKPAFRPLSALFRASTRMWNRLLACQGLFYATNPDRS